MEAEKKVMKIAVLGVITIILWIKNYGNHIMQTTMERIIIMKKFISVLIVLCVLVSLGSMSAWADSTEELYPKAIVTELDVNNLKGFTPPDYYPDSTLTCAYSYIVDMDFLMEHQEELAEYIDWLADFELVITGMSSEYVVFDAESAADGYLSGHYAFTGGNGAQVYDIWFNVPSMVKGQSITLENNERLKIMAKARQLLTDANWEAMAENFKVTCEMVAGMGAFDCGIYFTPEFLAANPDMKLNLALGITSPDGQQHHTVCDATIDPTPHFDLQEAVHGSTPDQPVTLPGDIVVSEPVVVSENVTIMLKDDVFDGALSLASGNGSLFKLEKDAVVTVKSPNDTIGSDKDLAKMREMLPKEYCVSRGSIIIKASHTLTDGTTCDVCQQPVAKPASALVPATADNRNMPLWAGLFIAFAAVAMLTAKKRRA